MVNITAFQELPPWLQRLFNAYVEDLWICEACHAAHTRGHVNPWVCRVCRKQTTKYPCDYKHFVKRDADDAALVASVINVPASTIKRFDQMSKQYGRRKRKDNDRFKPLSDVPPGETLPVLVGD